MAGCNFQSRFMTLNGNDSFTKLLLHGDGTNTSTTIIDSEATPKTMTANGNAQISTAQSKFNGASILFDGNGDYVSTPSSTDFDLTGDFTIDFWVRFNTLSRVNTFFVREDGAGTAEIIGRLDSTNTWDFFLRTGSGGGAIIGRLQPAGTVSTGTWYHMAYARSGSNFNLYQNGTSISNTTSASSGSSGYTQQFDIGGRHAGGATESLDGYIDEFRLSKGLARWTSNFTPPGAPYN